MKKNSVDLGIFSFVQGLQQLTKFKKEKKIDFFFFLSKKKQEIFNSIKVLN